MKRFTETLKWSDPWFQDLDPKFKLFWFYIVDNCDAAGVWKVNLRLACFQTRCEYTEDELLTAFQDRIESIDSGYWWIRQFCLFQYGILSDHCAPHRRVVELLKLHGLEERINGARTRKGSVRVVQG